MTTATETPGAVQKAAPGQGLRGSSSTPLDDGPRSTPSFGFIVRGVPAPQGSRRHVGGGRMIESSKKVKPWRQDVVAAARAVIDQWADWQPLDGPLAVTMVFSFARPKSHYRTGRNAHLLRDDAPVQPCATPDLDKLARSTCDALTTSGTIKDDARISEYQRLAKVWCGEDRDALTTTGALIIIRPIT